MLLSPMSDDSISHLLQSPRPPPPIWTWAEDDRPDRWERVAEQLPGKISEDVAETLLSDLALINSGVLGFPDYIDSGVGRAADDGAEDGAAEYCSDDAPRTPADVQEPAEGSSSRPSTGVPKPRRRLMPKEERKKPVPWTEIEHRLFLLGLRECVKGDWKSISRFWVRTKTPTQVTSHAQKFFKRQNGGGRSRRRSIHDIADPWE